MTSTIFRLHIVYIIVWAVTAAWILLSETGVVPVEYMGGGSRLDYYLSLLSVVTALGGSYFCLRLFSYGRIKALLEQSDVNGRKRAFAFWSFVRLGVLASALWCNAMLYYGTSYSPTPKYCLLIVAVASVFCWPVKPVNENTFKDTKM